MTPFDPIKASSFWVTLHMHDTMKLPLSSMFQAMRACLDLCVQQGSKQILYRLGQKFYQQLLSDEERNNSELWDWAVRRRRHSERVLESDGPADGSKRVTVV